MGDIALTDDDIVRERILQKTGKQLRYTSATRQAEHKIVRITSKNEQVPKRTTHKHRRQRTKKRRHHQRRLSRIKWRKQRRYVGHFG